MTIGKVLFRKVHEKNCLFINLFCYTKNQKLIFIRSNSYHLFIFLDENSKITLNDFSKPASFHILKFNHYKPYSELQNGEKHAIQRFDKVYKKKLDTIE